MNNPYTYTSAFGASLDLEISAAMSAGMTLERIYCELTERTREVGNAIVAKHLREESEKCAA